MGWDAAQRWFVVWAIVTYTVYTHTHTYTVALPACGRFDDKTRPSTLVLSTGDIICTAMRIQCVHGRLARPMACALQ